MNRHRVSYLLVITSLASTLWGCPALAIKEQQGAPRVQRSVLTEYAVGPLQVTTNPHDDGLGWSVHAEQVRVQEIQQETQESWVVRRYLFSPFSLFSGAVQCPFALFGAFQDDANRNYRRHGCMRLLMLEPLSGAIPVSGTTATKFSSEQRWDAVNAGVVQLVWPNAPDELVSFPLRDGRADVRLSALLVRLVRLGRTPPLRDDQTVIIRVRAGEELPIELAVRVSPSQFVRALAELPTPVAREWWPNPLIARVEADPISIPEDERESLRNDIMKWLLSHQYCVVVDDHIYQHVMDEYRVQYSSAVDDQHQLKLGHLLPATVSVVVDAEDKNNTKRTSIQIKSLNTGEVVATTLREGAFELTSAPFHLRLEVLDLLMANAPKSGCAKY